MKITMIVRITNDLDQNLSVLIHYHDQLLDFLNKITKYFGKNQIVRKTILTSQSMIVNHLLDVLSSNHKSYYVQLLY